MQLNFKNYKCKIIMFAIIDCFICSYCYLLLGDYIIFSKRLKYFSINSFAILIQFLKPHKHISKHKERERKKNMAKATNMSVLAICLMMFIVIADVGELFFPFFMLINLWLRGISVLCGTIFKWPRSINLPRSMSCLCVEASVFKQYM